MRQHPVREVMTKAPLHQLPPDGTVLEACRIMADKHIHCIVVMDGSRLRGVFTGRDAVRRVLGGGVDAREAKVGDHMTTEVDTISPDTSVADAIRQMDEFGYSHLPVMQRDELVGMISVRDFPLRDLERMRGELEDRHAFAERAW